MENIRFGWFDSALFFLTISFSAAIGIYFGLFKKQNTTADYLHGGKQMKIFPVAMSAAASMVSGIALLGVPSEIYLYGGQFTMMVVGVVFASLVVNYIFLPVFFKLQVTSIFEYLEMRFNSKVRSLTSGMTTIIMTLGLPIIIYTPSLAFNQVTGLNLHLTATLMCLFCVFYTSIGGIKTVIWTDTLQFGVTLATFFAVLIIGIISAGGFSEVWEKNSQGDRLEFFNMNIDPTERSTFWNVVIGNFFIWTACIGINQGILQRFLAVPTFKDSQKVLIILTVFTIITKIIGCFSGMIIFARYYNCDPLTARVIQKPDQIVPFYVMDIAKEIPGLGGLFTAGLCTTALSTLSTALNALSGIMYKDFLSPFMSPKITDKTASHIMKLITLILGIVMVGLIFVVEKLGTIFQIAMTFASVSGGPGLGLFCMGFLIPCVNWKGAFMGYLGSLIFMVYVACRSQMYVWSGMIKHVYKPLVTYGCNITTYETTTVMNNVTVENLKPNCTEEEPFWLYRLSFYYYMTLGTVVSIIIGMIVSWLCKDKDESPLNPDLFSPCIRRFLRKPTIDANTEFDKEAMLNGKDKEDGITKL